MRIFLLSLLTLAMSLPLEARDLHWKSLEVEARLDNEGVLHVVERHHYVFNGEWNGGERQFNIRMGQDFELVRLSRLEDGAVINLEQGDLSAVDRFGWSDNNTLRWRSRLESDPPFQNKEIVYEIEYTLGNILLTREKDGKTIYLLDHDFAFGAREGLIERYVLRLSFDDAWEPLSSVQSEYTAGPLNPGESYPLDVELAFQRDGVPAAVKQSAPQLLKRGVLAATAGAIFLMLTSFFSLERSRRRFEREPEENITTAWLEKNVFFAPPEVIGALWDVDTGAAEVAAIMARLAQEKKIETKVEKGGWLSGPSLSMTLLVPRQHFTDTERPLIDAFFVDGDATSTEMIRKHYSSRGFNPASVIKEGLEKAIGANPAWAEQQVARNWWRDMLLLLAAFALLFVAGSRGEPDMVAAVVVGVTSIIALMIGPAVAFSSRKAIGSLRGWAFGFTFPTLVQLMVLSGFVLSLSLQISSVTYVILGVVIAIIYWFIIGFAPFTESLERLAARRRLHQARAFFERELKKENPALKDEWFPYIMAFGLGKNVDRWFSSFGGASRATTGGFGGSSSSSGSASSGSQGGPSGSWSGGGTSFGGAGATGAWAAAAGGLAAGVAAPSSSGSSGGGGGGSSSGGGGGGGW